MERSVHVQSTGEEYYQQIGPWIDCFERVALEPVQPCYIKKLGTEEAIEMIENYGIDMGPGNIKAFVGKMIKPEVAACIIAYMNVKYWKKVH